MKATIKKVIVNEKEYALKNIDFNAICELEDLGVDIQTVKSKSLSLVRGLLAFHGNISADEAGKEIMLHLEKGGKFDDFTSMIEHFGNCDFFRLLSQKTEQETAEIEKTKDK